MTELKSRFSIKEIKFLNGLRNDYYHKMAISKTSCYVSTPEHKIIAWKIKAQLWNDYPHQEYYKNYDIFKQDYLEACGT